MKDQLITFETAKLAKEKGFNENCEYSYLWNKKHPEFDDVNETEKQRKSHNEYNIQIDGYSFLSNKYNCKHNVNYKILGYSAPTQSLLQKWLREEHNIKIWVEPVIKGMPEYEAYKKYKYIYHVLDEDNNDFQSGSIKNYNWEQILEKGLQEALKLIK